MFLGERGVVTEVREPMPLSGSLQGEVGVKDGVGSFCFDSCSDLLGEKGYMR